MPIYISLLIDFLLGDPKGFPHPIILVGKIISFYEKIFYRGRNLKRQGVLFTICVLATVLVPLALLLHFLSRWRILHGIATIYLLYTALAWKSLKVEPGKAIEALRANNLPKARRMLSYVVGRDTQNLNPIQIIKACIETVAENTIDGVLSPLFYMMIGYFLGVPVLFAYCYKTINTLDSMVGYKNDRYKDFGTCSARLDDVANFLPARIGAMIMLLAGAMLGYNARGGWEIWLRDRYAHKSPNSAQSESVVAGLLGLQLGGPNYYFGKLVDKPTIGRAIRNPQFEDYAKTCRILDWSVFIAVVIYSCFFLGSLL
jgi:adenosylcobinamide-phosphate synthase